MALPHPINGAEEYLRAIHNELVAIRELLEGRDRREPEEHRIEVREPRQYRTGAGLKRKG